MGRVSGWDAVRKYYTYPNQVHVCRLYVSTLLWSAEMATAADFVV